MCIGINSVNIKINSVIFYFWVLKSIIIYAKKYLLYKYKFFVTLFFFKLNLLIESYKTLIKIIFFF